MSPQVATTLSRLGLVFDVLAFFMVAPEIIGERRLTLIQKSLVGILWWLSIVLFALASLCGAVFALAVLLMPVLLSLPLVPNLIATGFTVWRPLTIFLLAGIAPPALAGLSLRIMDLVEQLTRDGKTRRLFLNVGVLVFIIGSLSQFLGTF